jgi:hypothetical protein
MLNDEPATNTKLGLKGVWAQVAQFGAVGTLIAIILVGGSAFYGLLRDDLAADREERSAQREVLNRVVLALESLHRNDLEQSVRLAELGRLFERIERRLSDRPVQDDAPHSLHYFPSAIVTLAIAADPKPTIRFPQNPTPPVPMPAADEPFALAPDRLFIIESDVPLLVFDLPESPSIVSLNRIEGPRSIFGKFADEPAGKNRLRDYSAKFLYVVEPLESGDVQLLLVPKGSTSEADAKRIRLRVGQGPRPPDPKPVDPKPTPAKSRRLATVVIEETADASAKRSTFFGSKELADRYRDRKHAAPTVADQNIRDGATNATPESLKPYVERAKVKALPQLYLIDLDTGDVVFEGPVPDGVADFLKLLDRVGG